MINLQGIMTFFIQKKEQEYCQIYLKRVKGRGGAEIFKHSKYHDWCFFLHFYLYIFSFLATIKAQDGFFNPL